MNGTPNGTACKPPHLALIVDNTRPASAADIEAGQLYEAYEAADDRYALTKSDADRWAKYEAFRAWADYIQPFLPPRRGTAR